jgi:hypothetical protein
LAQPAPQPEIVGGNDDTKAQKEYQAVGEIGHGNLRRMILATACADGVGE